MSVPKNPWKKRARKLKRQEEAKLRQAEYDKLPIEEKAKRNPEKFRDGEP